MPRKDYEKLFSHLKPPEPPEYLLGKIMARIRLEQKTLSLRKRAVLFFIGAAGSAIALVPAFAALKADLAQSGIAQFFLLLFSDFPTVVALWKEFTLSILETLPVSSIAVFLFTIFLFFGSLKLLAQDLKNIFAQRGLGGRQYYGF